MNHSFVSIVWLTLLLLTTYNDAFGASPWKALPGTLAENKVYRIVSDEFNQDLLLVASAQTVYQTTNGGKTWNSIFMSRDEDDIIRFIITEPVYTEQRYIGTTAALYRHHGATWKQLYTVDNSTTENQSSSTLTSGALNPFNPREFMLGTTDGLLFSDDEGAHWKAPYSALTSELIECVVYHPNIRGLVFVVTRNGMFTINRHTNTVTKTYSFLPRSDRNDPSELTDSVRTSMTFAVDDDAVMFVARGDDIITSTDYGTSWTPYAVYDPHREIVALASVPDALVIALPDTIIIVQTASQQPLPSTDGLYASRIYDLAVHDALHTVLFAATNKGIFSLSLSPPVSASSTSRIARGTLTIQELERPFLHEPSIQELHREAIQYANVHNDRMRAWHRNARLRGLLPTVSLEGTSTIERTIDIDRGGTADVDHFITGPHDRHVGGSVALEWDLANLIWNDDQTAIDYRAKYMIEMREDILTELTRLYFERRKLQIELHTAPPSEVNALVEVRLRIDELTAHIDALTGGYLSQCLQSNTNAQQ